MWEILHSTIKRTIRNIKKCTKELEESRTKLNAVSLFFLNLNFQLIFFFFRL